MKVLCENYENCPEFKSGVLEERCPHTIPHNKDEICDYECADTHFSCREIILKAD